MTSFSMDEHGNILKDPVTKEDLCTWANAYHQKYFSGSLPDIHIAIVDDVGGTACFDPTTKTAYFEAATTHSEKFSKIALLHEMVHINLFLKNQDPDKEHGPLFKAEIKRLLCAGAYDVLL